MALFTRTIDDDEIAVVDVVSPVLAHAFTRVASDAVVLADLLVVALVHSLTIDNARALTETKVRIDFSAPALANAALTNPSNYVFTNTSPGSVEIVPQTVSVPVGQTNPLYVEIEVTEQTEGASYEAALTSELRGAAGEVGNLVPFAFTGIGSPPTLVLVLATSPTDVEVHFSEAIKNNTSARDPNNYQWDHGISTVAVKSVIGEVVTIQTTSQVPGELYVLTVVGTTISASLPTDAVAVVDSIETAFTIGEEITESIAVTDTLATAKSFARRPSDTVAVTDLIRRTATYARSRVDTVVVTDTIARTLTKSRKAQDTVAVTDQITTALTGGPPVLTLPSLFAGTRSGANGPEIQTSPDDITWTSHNPSPGTSNVVRNGGRNTTTGTIILVGDSGLVLRSTDEGVTWAYSTPFTTFGGNSCHFGSGKWVVSGSLIGTGGKVWYSTNDGGSWTQVDPDAGGGSPAGFTDVFYDSMWIPALSLHVGVGYKGNIWTSPDGITWTHRTQAGGYIGSFYGFRGIAYSPSLGLIVAVGDPNEIQTSPNGTTWTHRTADASVTTFWDVAWSPTLGLFCAVGNGASSASKIQTSPDGITWTLRTPAAGANDFYSCSWDVTNSLFVIAGRFGKIQTSPDGINWTARTPANTGSDVIGNSSIFLMIGRGQGQ